MDEISEMAGPPITTSQADIDQMGRIDQAYNALLKTMEEVERNPLHGEFYAAEWVEALLRLSRSVLKGELKAIQAHVLAQNDREAKQ